MGPAPIDHADIVYPAVAIVLLIVAAAVYFFPWLLAVLRGHNNKLAIFAVNLLLGWTFIGWVFALVWACTKDTKKNTERDFQRARYG